MGVDTPIISASVDRHDVVLAGEPFAVPAVPALHQAQPGDPRHEVEFGRPCVALDDRIQAHPRAGNGHVAHVDAESIEIDTVRLDVLRHDPAKQMLDESHVSISNTGVRLDPIVQRYAWPAELDLMARIAGLRLKERWDGWNREPFTNKHNVVSVYGR